MVETVSAVTVSSVDNVCEKNFVSQNLLGNLTVLFHKILFPPSSAHAPNNVTKEKGKEGTL